MGTLETLGNLLNFGTLWENVEALESLETLGYFWKLLGSCLETFGIFRNFWEAVLETFGKLFGILLETFGKLFGNFWNLWKLLGSCFGNFLETFGKLLKLLRNFGNFWKLFVILETLETLATPRIFLTCFWGAGNLLLGCGEPGQEGSGNPAGAHPRGTGPEGKRGPSH